MCHVVGPRADVNGEGWVCRVPEGRAWTAKRGPFLAGSGKLGQVSRLYRGKGLSGEMTYYLGLGTVCRTRKMGHAGADEGAVTLEVNNLLGGDGSVCEKEGSVCMRMGVVGSERSRNTSEIIRE